MRLYNQPYIQLPASLTLRSEPLTTTATEQNQGGIASNGASPLSLSNKDYMNFIRLFNSKEALALKENSMSGGDVGAAPKTSEENGNEIKQRFTSNGRLPLMPLSLSVTAHLESRQLADRIDAQSRMPGAEVTKSDGARTTVDPQATDEQKLKARFEKVSIQSEILMNKMLFLFGGAEAKAVGGTPVDPNPDLAPVWLDLANAESNIEVLKTEVFLIYHQYGNINDLNVTPRSGGRGVIEERLASVEQRFSDLDKAMKIYFQDT